MESSVRQYHFHNQLTFDSLLGGVERHSTADYGAPVEHKVLVLRFVTHGDLRVGGAEGGPEKTRQEDAGDSWDLAGCERCDSEAASAHQRVRAEHGRGAALRRQGGAGRAPIRLLQALGPDASALLARHALGLVRVQ